MLARRRVLPQRAIALRSRFYVGMAITLAVALALAALPAAGAYWAASDVLDLRHEQAVWERGVPADGQIRGAAHSRLGLGWLLKSYDLDVEYTDARGVRHTGELEFMTLLGGPDTDGDPELRYDPAHPGDFAVSWGLDAAGARWRKGVVFGLILGVLSLAILSVAASAVRSTTADTRRCARDGEEVVARIANVRVATDDKGAPTTSHVYTLVPPSATGGDDPPITETIDHAKGLPLFADAADGSVFVLYLRGREPKLIVLRDGFAPLDLTAAEQAEARRRAEKLRFGPSTL